MISVTDRARERLKTILMSKVDNPEAALRLTADAQGEFGLSVDVEAPGDRVIRHKGMKVLVVEGDLASQLEGVTMDVEYTPEGPELTVYKGQQQ